MTTYILGLDISTSCTGWCILGIQNRTIISCDTGYIQLDNIDGTFNKANEVKRTFNILTSKYHIDKIYIEENLQSFKTGLSSAQVLVTLARFNGIVSYLSEDIFKISPVFINVTAGRKSLGLKVIQQSKGGLPVKEQVHNWVSHDLTSRSLTINWPYVTPTRGKNKGVLLLSKYAYDVADAYIMALAGYCSPS